MARLEVKSNKICLYTSYHDRDRAKSIQGWWWEADTKCWSYPNTPEIHSAIVAEFGDELTMADTHRVINATVKPSESVGADSVISKDDLDNLNRTLAHRMEQIAGLKEEVAELTDRLRKTEGELEGIRSSANKEPEVDNKTRSAQLIAYMKNIAIEASGHDEDFKILASELIQPDAFPVTARRLLEARLRNILGVGQSFNSLSDLISQARDVVLSPEYVDLAHLLRKQGNLMAHEVTDRRTTWARCFMTLYAASLVWPELSKASKK